jgi:hypothetical protein
MAFQAEVSAPLAVTARLNSLRVTPRVAARSSPDAGNTTASGTTASGTMRCCDASLEYTARCIVGPDVMDTGCAKTRRRLTPCPGDR